MTRWKQGEPMEPQNEELLRELDVVRAELEGFFEPSVLPEWLHGIDVHLGNRRPIDVIRDGRFSEVIRAIEAEKSGAFA